MSGPTIERFYPFNRYRCAFTSGGGGPNDYPAWILNPTGSGRLVSLLRVACAVGTDPGLDAGVAAMAFSLFTWRMPTADVDTAAAVNLTAFIERRMSNDVAPVAEMWNAPAVPGANLTLSGAGVSPNFRGAPLPTDYTFSQPPACEFIGPGTDCVLRPGEGLLLQGTGLAAAIPANVLYAVSFEWQEG